VASEQGKELSALDFGAMIGGPLTAVVKAQAQSALATATFVQQVGFEHDKDGNSTGKAMNVDFTYEKPQPDDANGNPQPPAQAKLSVPILTILPIPFIQVDDVTIRFNAKLLSTTHNELMTQSKSDTHFSAKTGGFFSWYGSASMSANFSHQRTQRNGAETKDQYSLSVLVRGGQADMPAGMDKVLNILESLIVEQKPQAGGGLTITISPTTAAVGSAVTITGSGFGTSPGTVTFGSTAATIVPANWTDSSISVDVPSGASGALTVTVTTATGTSGTSSFTAT